MGSAGVSATLAPDRHWTSFPWLDFTSLHAYLATYQEPGEPFPTSTFSIKLLRCMTM